jgi:glycerophosphoryl diester phosphodiesterase
MRSAPTWTLALAVVLALGVPCTAGAASNPWLGQRVLNFAHQGGEDELPSNTMYALRTSLRQGADALELDVGATKDGRLLVMHDNAVNRTTNGTGSISDMTLAQVRSLDAAYWFVPGRNAVHGLRASRYPLRGVRTGTRRPPEGFARDDFRIPTLDEVLRAFRHTPINVEIKGRDGSDLAVYLRTAELLGRLLAPTKRSDVIVTSFEQKAIDRFHELAPRIPLAPGIAGAANFILSNGSPGPNVVAFQVPITFQVGATKLEITTPDFVRRAHEAGYAVHVWLSNDTEDAATYRRLLAMCVDGIMAATPNRLEALLEQRRVGGPGRVGLDPCGTKVAARSATVSSAGTVTLPLARQGLSQESRRGTVTLRERGGGALLGRAKWSLADGAAKAAVDVRLTAAARRALASAKTLHADVAVTERGPASASTLVLRLGAG